MEHTETIIGLAMLMVGSWLSGYFFATGLSDRRNDGSNENDHKVE